MIKAKVLHPETGAPILIFGLSAGNVDRLQQGLPISFNLAELGIQPSIPVVIMYGDTEETMRAELARYFDMPEAEM